MSCTECITSLCLRRAEPADLIDFPVASFADCLPPAFALHKQLACQELLLLRAGE